jgi:hypothetical protein
MLKRAVLPGAILKEELDELGRRGLCRMLIYPNY